MFEKGATRSVPGKVFVEAIACLGPTTLALTYIA